jgi:hypothetical protein
MTRLIRQYAQTTTTYCVDHPTIGKEYIVNIVTRDPNNKPISISISVDDLEIEDESERELVLDKINEFQTENK